MDSKNSNEFLENQNKLVKKIQEEIVKKQGKPLSKEVKQMVKETVKGSTNTNYGIKNENKGTVEYTNITGQPVYSYNRFVKMPLLRRRRSWIVSNFRRKSRWSSVRSKWRYY